MWGHVVSYKFTSLSEKFIASIFVALFHTEKSNSKFLLNDGKFKQTTRRHIPADSILKLLRFLNIIFMQPGFQIRLSGWEVPACHTKKHSGVRRWRLN